MSIQIQHPHEVVQLYEHGLINKDEVRELLGLSGPLPPRRPYDTKRYDLQVVGRSGHCYTDVAQELWDLIPSWHRRIAEK